MDLITLLEHVPPLREACISDDNATLRSLRLVSKEASRVALLALRSLEIFLKGRDNDTNVCVARLLKTTQLVDLTLNLTLTDYYRPDELLKHFVREAGSSFQTVKNLGLLFGQEIETPASLDDAMIMLVAACPRLKYLHGMAHVSAVFQKQLGRACPCLTHISLNSRDSELHYLQQFVNLIPSLLPNLSKLSLLGMHNYIPDMSKSDKILDLDTNSFFGVQSQWLRLPPKLQNLRCAFMYTGPPPSTPDGCPLKSLLKLEYTGRHPELHVLTQILQAAPSLQSLQTTCPSEPEVHIHCTFSFAERLSMASDLAFLRDLNSNILKGAVFYAHCQDVDRSEVDMQEFFLSLPRMDGFSRCVFQELKAGNLAVLISMFPRVQQLRLFSLEDLEDVELLELAVCANLTWLELRMINNVSPAGLDSLCKLLPSLEIVQCVNCAQLKEQPL